MFNIEKNLRVRAVVAVILNDTTYETAIAVLQQTGTTRNQNEII